MASYAMAHLKMDMLLTETGYKASTDQRFRIFLTNSLEESHADTGTLFSSWLSDEADQANAIKRDTPVMVVMGNPPYSVSSSNKSPWIEKLTADYKKDMKERNIQPLSDDYIKFIRFGQHFIDKNGEGILAYISNNSFIDGIIHRQMRKHLLESFDKIYILDLHGNSKKKEVNLDGSADQNVFDIMQGVSINLFIKTGKKARHELADVLHFDLFGKRDLKYDFLSQNSIIGIDWKKLSIKAPNYFFIDKNFNGVDKYELGFKIDELFKLSNAGLATEFDELAIKNSFKEAEKLLKDLKSLTSNEILTTYNLNTNKKNKVDRAINDVLKNNPIITPIDYRPFDYRYTIYTGASNGIMGRPRDGIMKHMLKDNIALLTCRQQTSFDFQHVFISKFISERCSVSLQTGEVNYIFPLYLCQDINMQQSLNHAIERTPNLNSTIVSHLAEKLSLTFTNEKELTKDTFAPIDILDYIYAVLHSPIYRQTYKEFLKIDFPKIPYPTDTIEFWRLVKLGGALRQIHLLASSETENYITQYPVDGSNEVVKPKFELGKVFINEKQYFDNVPEAAWSFYIGGYQPAQKWLKDRKGRELGFEDILHYQKIIVALNSTMELMKKIDEPMELERI
jgi:predicted helicase